MPTDPHQRDPTQQRSRGPLVVLAGTIAAAIFALDQATKAWALTQLQGKPAVILHSGVLELELVFNTGSAFGILRDAPWARAFFITVTVSSLFYFAYLLRTLATRRPSAFIALGSILGGSLGNLTDRLIRVVHRRQYFSRGFRFEDVVDHATIIQTSLEEGRTWSEFPQHAVVDFIVIYYRPHHRWPAFNVADIALSCGIAVFIFFLYRYISDISTSGPPSPTRL